MVSEKKLQVHKKEKSFQPSSWDEPFDLLFTLEAKSGKKTIACSEDIREGDDLYDLLATVEMRPAGYEEDAWRAAAHMAEYYLSHGIFYKAVMISYNPLSKNAVESNKLLIYKKWRPSIAFGLSL